MAVVAGTVEDAPPHDADVAAVHALDKALDHRARIHKEGLAAVQHNGPCLMNARPKIESVRGTGIGLLWVGKNVQVVAASVDFQ